MDNDLLTTLKNLLPAQFQEVVHRYPVPSEYLSHNKPQTEQAIEVLRYVRQHGGGEAQLQRLIQQSQTLPNLRTRLQPVHWLLLGLLLLGLLAFLVLQNRPGTVKHIQIQQGDHSGVYDGTGNTYHITHSPENTKEKDNETAE